MAALYIKEQGASVQKMGERIIVTKNSQTLLDIPIFKIENISIIGNVQVTTQALYMLMENGVDVSYFTYGGKYLGHTGADSSKNIFLRFEQYSAYLNEQKRLGTAKIIVDNKIRNQITVIEDHRWKPEENCNWHEIINKMETLRQSLQGKETSNEILGVEGMCSNLYFDAFAKMMKGDFVFESRNRRPPKDPVNIILSLAYTFLTKEVSSALDSESFETYLGFLHGIRYGRKSLALDIVEEFRQPAVDRMTIFLFSKRILGKFDFDLDEDTGRMILNEDGFKKFCTEYEKWMMGRNVLSGDNFRKRIHDQASVLRKSIMNNEQYVPYCWKENDVRNQLRSEQ